MGLQSLAARHHIGGERQVIVTEVTRMSGGLTCVAGLDLHSGKMVRPLQPSGSNWEEAKWVATGYMEVGNVLSLVPAARGQSAYPHANEDFRVATVRILEKSAVAELYEACAETAGASVDSLFHGALNDGKYVVAGTQCPSLGCIMVPPGDLKVSDFYGKVQVSYQDGDHRWHNFSVTELTTKGAGNVAAGVATLSARITSSNYLKPVALRLGLARPWAGKDKTYDPKRCYVQLNGVIVSNQ